MKNHNLLLKVCCEPNSYQLHLPITHICTYSARKWSILIHCLWLMILCLSTLFLFLYSQLWVFWMKVPPFFTGQKPSCVSGILITLPWTFCSFTLFLEIKGVGKATLPARYLSEGWMLLSVEKRNAHSFTENVSFVTYLVECPIWAVRWALSWWRGSEHLIKRPWRFWWLLKFAARGNRKQQPGKRENSSQNVNLSHCLLAIQNSGNTPDVFCYNFNLWNIFIRSNNTNKMPERSTESILLISLIGKEYFVPGGSLFWGVYQWQFFLPTPQNLFELQVFKFK